MKLQLTSLVRIESQQMQACKNFQNLSIKIFQVTLSAEKLLQTFALSENGMANGELEAETATTLMARLYLNEADKREKETLVAESGPHCPKHGMVFIEFTYDPAKFGKPLYTTIKASVTAQLGKISLRDLTDQQQKQLQCIACVGERTLDRLINAARLLNDLQINMRSCSQKMERALKQQSADSAYLKKALANMQLLASADIAESILFALLKTDNSQQLHRLLTLSASQLQQKITQAVAEHIIAPISNLDKITDGLMALRNCMLFNSNYDQYFYDAKLIHLTSLDLKSKNILLDKTIEAGSLSGFLGEEDNRMNSVATTLN